jgi:LEA14-like dessication related protein
MNARGTSILRCILLVSSIALSACASVSSMVNPPEVNLRGVQMTEFSFTGQTFLLDFDVSNPNPYPLPVKSVKYGVELDGHTFATGNTQGEFSIPASGDSEFSISVDLNLLQTAPKLLSIVRDGARHDIPYQIEGELGIDIPYAPPVSFRSGGEIRLQTSAF